MYYSYYMNERMLLDNWKYYQEKGECNWLLKRTLMNDNTRTPEERIQFYFENRRVVNHYSEFFKEQAQHVRDYIDELDGCFENETEMEYFLDNKYINDDYEIMDYGRNQKLFNMYRRYNDLQDNANELIVQHLSYEPKSNYKLREHKMVLLNKKDIKFIRHCRKYNTLTVPQIEVLFGIIFFCRMNRSEKANLDTEFKKKQFIGCFDSATLKDFEYVTTHIYNVEIVDGDVVYFPYSNIEDEDEWIEIPVTRLNNKLNLSKMAHKYIVDISDKRYCEMCIKPFTPTNNRQKVCECCKPKVDAIRAKMRKTKQRFIEKNGKDACCGCCTDCTNPACGNWWEYWWNELDTREIAYRNDNKYRTLDDIPQEERDKVLDQLLHDIKNVYTEEQKSEIIPWEIIRNSKRYF